MASAKSNKSSTGIKILATLTPDEKGYFKKHELLVQGDEPNTWFPAQEWQMAMLANAGFRGSSGNEGSISITQHMICPLETKFTNGSKIYYKYTILPANTRYMHKVYLINEDTKKVREMIIIDAKPEHTGAQTIKGSIKEFAKANSKTAFGEDPDVSGINGGGRKIPFSLSGGSRKAKRGTKIPFSLA